MDGLVAFTKSGALSKENKGVLGEMRKKLEREGFVSPISSLSSGICYLLLDHSGSMEEGEKLPQAKAGAKDFAKEAIRKGYSVGLIKFSAQAVLVCKPTKNLSDFVSLVDSLEADSNTEMAQAIRLAREKLIENKSQRAVVIVTDGMPDSKEKTLSEIALTKELNIDIITIGTDRADENFLRQIATRAELATWSLPEAFAENIGLAARNLPMLTR